MAGGREKKLTPAVSRTICKAVESGLTYRFAAGKAGVSERTLKRWVAAGKRDERADTDSPDRHFWHQVQLALAKSVEVRINRIANAGKGGDWRADAWWLERMFPEVYGANRNDIAELVKLLKAGRAGLGDGG